MTHNTNLTGRWLWCLTLLFTPKKNVWFKKSINVNVINEVIWNINFVAQSPIIGVTTAVKIHAVNLVDQR